MKDVKFKKGDTACIIDRMTHPMSFVAETEVLSSGAKFITTEFDRQNKFDTQTLTSTYMGYMIFKGNKEECLDYIEKQVKAKSMAKELIDELSRDELDYDLVKAWYDDLNERNDPWYN